MLIVSDPDVDIARTRIRVRIVVCGEQIRRKLSPTEHDDLPPECINRHSGLNVNVNLSETVRRLAIWYLCEIQAADNSPGVLADIMTATHFAVIFLFRGEIQGAQEFALVIIQPFDV